MCLGAGQSSSLKQFLNNHTYSQKTLPWWINPHWDMVPFICIYRQWTCCPYQKDTNTLYHSHLFFPWNQPKFRCLPAFVYSKFFIIVPLFSRKLTEKS